MMQIPTSRENFKLSGKILSFRKILSSKNRKSNNNFEFRNNDDVPKTDRQHVKVRNFLATEEDKEDFEELSETT